MAEWVCTDDDCAQWQMDLGNNCYEMWQVQAGPDWEYYMVASGLVFVDDRDSDEHDRLCRTYGYHSLKELADIYGENSKAILAEFIFEEDIRDYLEEVYSPQLKYQRFDTFNDAERFIRQKIGMEN